MRSPALAPFTLAVALVSLAACSPAEEAPGEIFEGVLEAEIPLKTPATDIPACLVGVSVWARSQAGAKGTSFEHKAVPHWAEGVTLRVGDERLTLDGPAGDPEFAERGEVWTWNKYQGEPEPPPALLGWGQDSILAVLDDPAVDHSHTHVEAREEFTRCGESTHVRAIRKGDVLELVDSNPTNSRNALRLFGGIALAFLFLLVLPILGLIAWVVARARRKNA